MKSSINYRGVVFRSHVDYFGCQQLGVLKLDVMHYHIQYSLTHHQAQYKSSDRVTGL